MDISDCGDNSRNKIILQSKNVFRAEGSVVSLSPKMCSCTCIHELNGYTQHGGRLAQTSFHNIARTDFLTGCASIYCYIGVSKRGTPRDHPKVRESGESSYDFLGHSFSKRFEFGITAATFERQNCNPE